MHETVKRLLDFPADVNKKFHFPFMKRKNRSFLRAIVALIAIGVSANWAT
jgi:hypothetical protein